MLISIQFKIESPIADYSQNGTRYQQVKYTYDNRSRLASVSVSKGTGSSFSSRASYTYDANDYIVKTTYGNGMYNNYTYNSGNLVSAMDLKSSSGEILQSMSYVYNRAGNMTEKTEIISGQTVTTSYNYDDVNRLICESATGDNNYKYYYDYDVAGNRSDLSFYKDGKREYSEAYTYDKNNRLTLISKITEDHPNRNTSWNDTVKSTQNGPAKYSLDIDNVETFERNAWGTGTPVNNGKNWRVKEYDHVIGASGGQETKYVRIENSANTIHEHPITASEYKKLTR